VRELIKCPADTFAGREPKHHFLKLYRQDQARHPGTAIINQGDKSWFEVRLERAVSSFVPNEFDFLLEPAVSA
jgi:hypothetical protein